MEDFFEELEVLLKKYNATIIRSANDERSIVCSVDSKQVGVAFPRFRDFQFEEDITESSIRYGNYKELK